MIRVVFEAHPNFCNTLFVNDLYCTSICVVLRWFIMFEYEAIDISNPIDGYWMCNHLCTRERKPIIG